MDRLTRHELKQDDLQEVIETLQEFGRKYYRQIAAILGAAIVIIALVVGFRSHAARQEAEANAALQQALQTFNAYVGNSAPGSLAPSDQTFPTAQEKYKKALGEFLDVVTKYPRTKAATYARIHVGICQAQIGNQSAADQTLREAAQNSDPKIASLAQFTLAGELARGGKTDEAAKLYQNLANHPTLTVPRATALLALADLYRSSQPARAREIYLQVQKEFGSDQVLAEAIKQQIDGLPN